MGLDDRVHPGIFDHMICASVPLKGSIAPCMTLDFDLKMAQPKVKLLRAQYSSHFLFNHLNAINSCIVRNDPKVASSYLTQFSRLLRRLTADSRRNFVRLLDEMETIGHYIRIESLRYGKPIRFLTKLDPGIAPTHVWVPSLISRKDVLNTRLKVRSFRN